MFKDQLNNTIVLSKHPKRIISLVPSQTEFLYTLGLDSEVVGITKFCIHPTVWFRNKKRIGGTKQFNLELIEQLEPDLIIGNKEENDKAQIELLQTKFPVWMSDIVTFEDALEMMMLIGKLVNRTEQANIIIQNIIQKKNAFQSKFIRQKPLNVAYFIWRKPYMVAANETYINEMLTLFGAKNVFENQSRYPSVELSELSNLDIDAIFLSSEPYPFKDKHLEEFRAICPNATVVLVDGEAFSWYGNRMIQAFEYFEILRLNFIR